MPRNPRPGNARGMRDSHRFPGRASPLHNWRLSPISLVSVVPMFRRFPEFPTHERCLASIRWFASDSGRIDDHNPRPKSGHSSEVCDVECHQMCHGVHMTHRDKAGVMNLLADGTSPRRCNDITACAATAC